MIILLIRKAQLTAADDFVTRTPRALNEKARQSRQWLLQKTKGIRAGRGKPAATVQRRG